MTQNEEITDFSKFQYLVDGFNTEKARIEAERLAAEQAAAEAETTTPTE